MNYMGCFFEAEWVCFGCETICSRPFVRVYVIRNTPVWRQIVRTTQENAVHTFY